VTPLPHVRHLFEKEEDRVPDPGTPSTLDPQSQARYSQEVSSGRPLDVGSNLLILLVRLGRTLPLRRTSKRPGDRRTEP
jgi:hypothetical protein